jgi:hypothetical protein
MFTRSRDSVVSAVTRLQAEWPRNLGSIPGRGKRFISIPQRPDQLWGLLNLVFNWGGGGHLLEVKQPGRAAEHSPNLVERLRMSADTPIYALWLAQGHLKFDFMYIHLFNAW